MIWAIVSKSGSFSIRHDDPAMTESKINLRQKAVWPLEREPKDGERVSFETGQIEIDPDPKRNAVKKAAEYKTLLAGMTRAELIEYARAPLIARIEALEGKGLK